MLEVSHLTKIYKNKNGVDIKALDDVSLKFPETGMVFLLGKSGSGKSTLLNVCGGLDTPTSGEIIVKGRSSRDFTQGDFDSYRNTFVGFIFQEYNILDDFTVEENIGLALELQGKSRDRNAINELLLKVDLEGYGRRKPNTLSGGQKQRIAIARALIKDPEIIMADEPTGALDSITGKQVLETLKKLSKDTLVIVVSHDHEFAHTYGDRIIELKDGKVVADITKVKQKSVVISDNVSEVGNVLCIKNANSITDKEFKKIKEFIINSKDDIIIANGKDDVGEFKKISNINDDGSKEVFDKTDVSKIDIKKYTSEDAKFIRSKLPQKHAFRIGMSGLKTKPVRLVFTILLCTLAFVFFGILSTMTFYDSERTFKQTISDLSIEVMQLSKVYNETSKIYFDGEYYSDFESVMTTKFTDEEIIEIKKEYGNDAFGAVTAGITFNVQAASSEYWVNRIERFATIESDNKIAKDMLGSLPTKDEEIVLSSYLVDVIINNKAYDYKGQLIDIKERKDIIGKQIIFGTSTYTVTGVIDTGKIDKKYNDLKEGFALDTRLNNEYLTMLSDSLHLVVFVTPDKLASLSNSVEAVYVSSQFEFTGMSKKGENEQYESTAAYAYQDMSVVKSKNDVIWLGDKTALSDKEVVASTELFAELMVEHYTELLANSTNNQDFTKYQKKLDMANALLSSDSMIFDDKGVGKTLSVKERVQYLNELSEDAKNLNLKFSAKLYSYETEETFGDAYTFEVTGIWNAGTDLFALGHRFIVSDEMKKELWDIQSKKLSFYSEYETDYIAPLDAYYDVVYLTYNDTEEEKDDFYKLYVNTEENDDFAIYRLTGMFVENLRLVDEVIDVLSNVFFWAGIVLAAFAILLFSNFIAVSISQKTKDIGILRAVGAKGSDVFKIFFSESFVIGLICLGLSIVFTLMASNVINSVMATEIGVSLFAVGLPTIVILITIAIITSVIATFLPVFKAARRKPVECIRSL